LYNTTGKHCHECKPGYHGNALKRTCSPNRIILAENQTTPANSKSSSDNTNLDYLNKKYSYKTLALFSLYIFCLLGLVLLTFLCVKARYYQNEIMKNEQSATTPNNAPTTFFSSLAYTCHSTLREVNEATKSHRARLGIYFGWLYPSALKNIRLIRTNTGANVTSRGGIYTAANSGLNDDDRLNLAEYQVFDDSLFGDDSTNIYQPSASAIVDMDDVQTSNNNPYKSLTVKS
jgi:hypothetical protein